eukprot:6185365-Pleurochrysis_carterae.AAC.1
MPRSTLGFLLRHTQPTERRSDRPHALRQRHKSSVHATKRRSDRAACPPSCPHIRPSARFIGNALISRLFRACSLCSR